MIKSIFFVFFICISFLGLTQMYNNAAVTVVGNTAVTVANGTLRNDALGEIDNNGNIYVDVDIDNAGQITGNSLTSEFNLGEDWINDNQFNANSSTVRFFGNDQFITGSSITRFYNLILAGNGVKAQSIDALTTFLDLTSNELATNDYTIEVLSTNTNAIARTSGFVSSLNDGHLIRNVNSTGAYLFPTGSSIQATGFYRPIVVEPNDNSTGYYGVRLAHTNASNEGYPINVKEADVKDLNPNFYHHLYQGGNSQTANITFHYLPEDGEFEKVGQWTSNSIWEMNYLENLNASTFNEVMISNVSNYDTRAFILGNKLRQIYIQNAFSPNGDQINDVFSLVLDEEDFEDFQFRIFNRWGEEIFSTDKSTFTWDGTYKGVLSQIGVYPWTLSYRYPQDSEVKKLSGHLTIIR